MDDLRLIEDLGRDVPAWTDDDLAGARAALAAEIGGAAPAGSASPAAVDRPFRWRRRVLGALVSAAVAAAVAVLVVLATTVFVGSDHTAVQPPTIDTATRQALLAAADTAGRQPDVVPRPDQFLYVSDGPGVEAWYSIDGTHDGMDFGSLPQGGSGTTVIPGCRNGRQAVTKGGRFMPGVTQPCTPDPAYLPDLPTDPQQLMTYLEKHDHASADDPNTVGKSVWDLVHSHYLRPSQWAALFQALAQLPGLRVHQHATDPAGHPAFGISWTNAYGDDGELFFDPHTFRFTGLEAGKGKGIETGPMAIVDRPGDRP
jgi:hypothetical protein